MRRKKKSLVYYGSDFRISRSEAIDILNRNGTVRESAKEIGCSYGTANKIFKALRISLPNRGRRKVEIAKEDLQMYAEGFSWRQIADAFEVSVHTIRKEFKRHKIKKRDERSKNDWHPCDLN